MYWCLFLLAFIMMARKSQMVPNTIAESKSGKQMKRNDIVTKETDLIVNIHWSKTIKFGERKLQIPILSIPDSPLCPVSA